MLKLLIIKMSSLGDVVHMLPALTEAVSNVPGLVVDWVVEEGFADIPNWHPAVRHVLPIGLRRWRKQLLRSETWGEIRQFQQRLRQDQYDIVLDSQGLIKSAVIAWQSSGKRVGLDAASAREALASWSYHSRLSSPSGQHAIWRNRVLTAQALNYPLGDEVCPSYGITPPNYSARKIALPEQFLLAFHGTARPEKEYPEVDWIKILSSMPCAVLLPWGNDRERQRAERMAAEVKQAIVLPKLSLTEIAGVLARAKAVIGVDTGLMHLAAAFKKPGLALYPATPPRLYGVQRECGAPVLESLSTSAELTPSFVEKKINAILMDN